MNEYETFTTQSTCPPSGLIPLNATFAYDTDGNMTRLGIDFTCTWDAENRLLEVAPVILGWQGTGTWVDFLYDYRGRRVQKTVTVKTLDLWDELVTTTTVERYVYDGWNVVLVLDGGNTITRKLTWGLDLSGTLQGAGGIGGLLAVEETDGEHEGAYWYMYDGNGNVTQVLAAGATPTLAAHYEYDPYGKVVYSTGTYADANPIRFSTKWLDAETGLYYYGYRYYNARVGRWMNRDPIGEIGGLNLYSIIHNRPNTGVDPLGTVPACPAKPPERSKVGDKWCYEGPNPFHPGLDCYRSYGDGEIGGQQCCYDPKCPEKKAVESPDTISPNSEEEGEDSQGRCKPSILGCIGHLFCDILPHLCRCKH